MEGVPAAARTPGRVAKSSAAAPFLQVTAHLDAPEDTPLRRRRGGMRWLSTHPCSRARPGSADPFARSLHRPARAPLLLRPSIGAIEAAEAAAAVGPRRPPLAQAERASDGEAATVVAGAQPSLQLTCLSLWWKSDGSGAATLSTRREATAASDRRGVPAQRPRLANASPSPPPQWSDADLRRARNDDSHNDTASALRLWVHVGIGLAFTSERARCKRSALETPPPARRMTLGSDVTPVAPPRSRTASARRRAGAAAARDRGSRTR